jgi:hypothetical protein
MTMMKYLIEVVGTATVYVSCRSTSWLGKTREVCFCGDVDIAKAFGCREDAIAYQETFPEAIKNCTIVTEHEWC